MGETIKIYEAHPEANMGTMVYPKFEKEAPVKSLDEILCATSYEGILEGKILNFNYIKNNPQLHNFHIPTSDWPETPWTGAWYQKIAEQVPAHLDGIGGVVFSITKKLENE